MNKCRALTFGRYTRLSWANDVGSVRVRRQLEALIAQAVGSPNPGIDRCRSADNSARERSTP